jgi:hypothetical protein
MGQSTGQMKARTEKRISLSWSMPMTISAFLLVVVLPSHEMRGLSI